MLISLAVNMEKRRTMTELRPSRTSARVSAYMLATMLGLSLLAYLVSKQAGRSWSATEVVGLMIVCAGSTLFTWYAFVPRLIRYNQNELEVTPRLSGVSVLPFSALFEWGISEQTIVLKFIESNLKNRTVTFAPAFYPKKDIETFLSFLRTNFPDRKSVFGIGW